MPHDEIVHACGKAYRSGMHRECEPNYGNISCSSAPDGLEDYQLVRTCVGCDCVGLELSRV
ncbi:hypothetical protein E2562_029870 [Oryza meyeriana var. granulata]|uniref:Uncharacterized protein n=1 Tax=Oryza meyeriana var. granulata TaxID=110450 RepID=A0A6G1ER29_9ORYZ|nr:hypothetical protein E2562_029870 [Oryza meyeriana var. granulata]